MVVIFFVVKIELYYREYDGIFVVVVYFFRRFDFLCWYGSVEGIYDNEIDGFYVYRFLYVVCFL